MSADGARTDGCDTDDAADTMTINNGRLVSAAEQPISRHRTAASHRSNGGLTAGIRSASLGDAGREGGRKLGATAHKP